MYYAHLGKEDLRVAAQMPRWAANWLVSFSEARPNPKIAEDSGKNFKSPTASGRHPFLHLKGLKIREFVRWHEKDIRKSKNSKVGSPKEGNLLRAYSKSKCFLLFRIATRCGACHASFKIWHSIYSNPNVTHMYCTTGVWCADAVITWVVRSLSENQGILSKSDISAECFWNYNFWWTFRVWVFWYFMFCFLSYFWQCLLEQGVPLLALSSLMS